MNIGVMQGRLSDQIDQKIQSFPWPTWQDEFQAASDLDISLIEWTLDQDRLRENPILTKKGQDEINALTLATNVTVPSLTGDCFMQAPFFQGNGVRTCFSIRRFQNNHRKYTADWLPIGCLPTGG